MQFIANKSLAELNTLGFNQLAERYIDVDSEEMLSEVVEYANKQQWPIFILGGGSNIVLTNDIPGLVIRLSSDVLYYENRGEENSWLFRLTAAAGANWHRLVRDTMSRGLTGLENLSLIPGSTGAAPIQNIGAYGVELADRFESLRALHLPTNEWRTFDLSDCEFGYRDSYFKRHAGEYCVSSVNLMIGNDKSFETSYASLHQALERLDVDELTPVIISDTVCEIRRGKLPDPAQVCNAGSFFHNPVVSEAQYNGLKQRFSNLVAYPQPDGTMKLAAGWLIDSLGLRGNRRGAVGVYDKQALVLVHHGGGSGDELLAYAQSIQSGVRDKYGIELTMEPEIVPQSHVA